MFHSHINNALGGGGSSRFHGSRMPTLRGTPGCHAVSAVLNCLCPTTRCALTGGGAGVHKGGDGQGSSEHFPFGSSSGNKQTSTHSSQGTANLTPAHHPSQERRVSAPCFKQTRADGREVYLSSARGQLRATHHGVWGHGNDRVGTAEGRRTPPPRRSAPRFTACAVTVRSRSARQQHQQRRQHRQRQRQRRQRRQPQPRTSPPPPPPRPCIHGRFLPFRSTSC